MPRPRIERPSPQARLVKRAKHLQSLARTADAIRGVFRTPREIAAARGHAVSLMTIYNHLTALERTPGVRIERESAWVGQFGPAAKRYKLTACPRDAFTVPGVTDRLPPLDADPPACREDGCAECRRE